MQLCRSRSLMVRDRKSTSLNSSHTEIYTLSLHDALPIYIYVLLLLFAEATQGVVGVVFAQDDAVVPFQVPDGARSEEHKSELQSHRDLHSFPTRRSSDLHLRTPAPFRRSATGSSRRCFRAGRCSCAVPGP